MCGVTVWGAILTSRTELADMRTPTLGGPVAARTECHEALKTSYLGITFALPEVNKFITYSVRLAVLLFAVSLGMASEEAPSPLEGWGRLRLEGRKFLVAKAHVDLERWPDAGRMRCESVLKALGVDRRHEAHAWSPAEGRPLAWVELSEGRKLRVALRGPGEASSLEVRRYKPGDAEDWTDLEVEEVELDAGESRLLDAWYALVELPALAEGGVHRVLTKDGPIDLRVESRSLGERTLRLEELASGERREVRVDALELSLTRAGEGETLLGLSGPTLLLIDRRTGAILEARGEKDGVPGTIRLRLTGFASEARAWREPWLTEDARARLDKLDAAPASP